MINSESQGQKHKTEPKQYITIIYSFSLQCLMKALERKSSQYPISMNPQHMIMQPKCMKYSVCICY